MDKLTFSYEPPPVDVITIEGIRYTGELFRGLGRTFEPGTKLEIVKREDGALHVKRLLPEVDKTS